MELSSLAVLVFLLLVPTAVTRYIREWLHNRRFSREHGCQPVKGHVKTKDPILGLDLILENLRAAKSGRFVRLVYSRFKRFGRTFTVTRGTLTSIATSEPENAKAILGTNFDDYVFAPMRIKTTKFFLGVGIFATSGPAWSHARTVLRPCFTRQNMAPLLTMLERHMKILLRQVPRDGKTVDLRELFSNLTTDSACEFLMGHPTHMLDPDAGNEDELQFVRDFHACSQEAVIRMAMWPFSGLRYSREANKTRNRLFAYVDRFVDEALQQKNGGAARTSEDDDVDGVEYNFLTVMARESNDRALLRDQVINVFLASRDTTAALLTNLFWVLARQPEIYAKIRAEVLRTVKGELPVQAELHSMQYLRWCINESLRIHPPVMGGAHQAVRDTILPRGGGADGTQPVFIKKGSSVGVNFYAMHRREEVYGADTETFRPERWDGLRPGWAFLPFNGGPRVCIGQQFALTQASYVIARIAQIFETLENRDDQPWAEDYFLVMTSAHGAKVCLREP